MIASFRRRVPYGAGLARKSRRAARYPWLRVGPDPPVPWEGIPGVGSAISTANEKPPLPR